VHADRRLFRLLSHDRAYLGTHGDTNSVANVVANGGTNRACR
jgi:hypothetical protein